MKEPNIGRALPFWLLVIAASLAAGAFAQFDYMSMSFACTVVALFNVATIAVLGMQGHYE